MVALLKLRVAILLMASCFATLKAQVTINEIFATNASLEMDLEHQNFYNWIELYNNNDEQVSIGGWRLSIGPNILETWQIPASTIIAAKGFYRVWTSRLNQAQHASFNLDGDGNELYLLNEQQEVVDHIVFGKQRANISNGRYPDGSGAWVFFHKPTPAASNSSPGYDIFSGIPDFSMPGGFYSGNQTLTLIYPYNENANIYYTTDGSEPNETSALYLNPILLSKNTIVRARAYDINRVPGETVTRSYFINERRSKLPIVSIAANDTHFFDNTIGIYVNGTNGLTGRCSSIPVNWNRDWERPVNVELFVDGDGVALNQYAGAKMFGGCSRGHPLKSIALRSRDRYGQGSFRCRLFHDKDTDQFDSFVLRNSGNDMNQTMFRDAYIQNLLIGQMDIDYQAYRPSVAYINGAYWGILNIREKVDRDFIKSNFGLERTEFDMLEQNSYVVEGDSTEYIQLINYVSTNDLTKSEHFQHVSDRIDISHYIDYQIIQIYSANTDWPGNNIKFWKKRGTGNKWRWIIYDTDFGYGIWDRSPAQNSLAMSKEPNGPIWPNPPWSTLLFRQLLTNLDFKNEFIGRFCTHIQTTFDPTRCHHVLDSLKSNIEDEMPYHLNRWGGSFGNWNNRVNFMRNWTTQRPDHMFNHLQQEFGLGSLTQITVSGGLGTGQVLVNNKEVNPMSFSGRYFSDIPLNLKFIPKPGYQFKIAEVTSTQLKPEMIVPRDTIWHYHDGGENLGTAWRQPGYNFSGWASGPAKLGYGDGDENTVISYGGNSSWKHITTYFLKTFDMDDPDQFSGFTLHLLRDDGAVIFINGNEVVRSNMPAGDITFETHASQAIDENWFFDFNLTNDHFVQGENIIAIEVHQANRTSSDVGFNLELEGFRKLGDETTYYHSYDFTLFPSANTNVKAEFTIASPITGIVINEFSASNTLIKNSFDQAPGWIELYNGTSEPIDLAGLYLSDKASFKSSWMIPYGYKEETTVAPGGYLVIWADQKPLNGPLHAAFGLSSLGGEVLLTQVIGTDTLVVDEVSYGWNNPNHSYSRIPSGSGPWMLTSTMTPMAENIYSMPSALPTHNPGSISIYPNPATEWINLHLDGFPFREAQITIRDTRGIVLYEQSTYTEELVQLYVGQLAPGLYIIEIANYVHRVTGKFVRMH